MPSNKVRLSKKERKLERKRREIEKKRLNVLEYLRREIKYGNITRKRYDKRWKELLSKISLEKSREELEYAWQKFEWTLDVKDFIISKLMDDLKKANDQTISALESHDVRIEMLLNQYMDMMDCMHNDYLEEVDALKAYYKEQDDEYASKFESQQEMFKGMLFRMDREMTTLFRDQMAERYMFFESRTDDFMQQSQELETEFETRISNIWAKCTELYDAYLKCYKRKIKEFQSYRDAHKEAVESNEGNLKTIVNLVNVQKTSRAKLERIHEKYDPKLENLTNDRERKRSVLATLVTKVSRDLNSDESHTKLLVSRAANTLDFLERLANKGEILLKMMWCNKKYETIHEKVLPYPTEKNAIRAMEDINEKLFYFNFKLANVDSTRMTLNEERKFLKLENMKLMELLETYCGGYQTCLNKTGKYLQKSSKNPVYRCRIPEMRALRKSKLKQK